jgi:hypothetical protein
LIAEIEGMSGTSRRSDHPQGEMASMCDYLRCMRYLISRQWSLLQDFDITGESGDLRYQVR